MKPGQVRLDLGLTGLGVRVRHVATCPEDDPVHCATEDIPDYVHDQSITWGRATLGATVSLGKGWQVGATLPGDVRILRIRYEDLEGDPYDPPYPNIHHRDETLAGPVDGAVEGRWFGRSEAISYGGALGVTLPLGRTEADPYALTEEGLPHQHQQLGSGVFQPTFAAQIYSGGDRWGGFGRLDGRLGLYANSKGYQPPMVASLTGGPLYKLSPTVQLVGTAQLQAESAERWSGDPYGGRLALLAGLGAMVQPTPGLTFQLDARTTPVQVSLETHGDEALRQWLILGLGASWVPTR